jgi:hypothetical protein
MLRPPEEDHVERTTERTAEPTVARPSGWLAVAGGFAAVALTIAALTLPAWSLEGASPTGLLTAQVVLGALAALSAGATVGPMVRYRIEVRPGELLQKRAWRTRSVDLSRLTTVRSRGDHPYGPVAYLGRGKLGFEDADGRCVWVPLGFQTLDDDAHLEVLAAEIERCGSVLPGIQIATLEQRLGRDLVGPREANRRALAAAIEAARAGRFLPHAAKVRLDQRAWLWWLAAATAWIAAWGAWGQDVDAWMVVATAAAVTTLIPVARLRGRLRVSEDGQLTRRGLRPARTVDLTELVEVRLVPDRPYLERTLAGRRTDTSPVPHLRLTDGRGSTLRVALGSTWQELHPVLVAILAAADARGLDLSAPTRCQLAYLTGVEAPHDRW